MPTLALVALSARALAQAAARDGYRAVAIDCFGDLDTRRACATWLPAAVPGSLKLDAQRILAHLRQLALDPDVIGWVPGGGCEGEAELLAAGAAILPLIGCPAPTVQRVREPELFFAGLRSHGLAHPETRFSPPADRSGWLVKNAGGCGGWHVQPADAVTHPLQAGTYFQRLAPGRAMSATFCANGEHGVVLGFNEAVPHAGGLPCVHGGVLGPVALPQPVAAELRRAVALLSRDAGLRGLGSLDFMFDGTTARILEVNPRPSASMVLYADRVAGGLMRAHVEACLRGRMPWLTPPAQTCPDMRGECIVFAPRSLQVDGVLSLGLQGRGECHDLPAAGTALRQGDPLCSVSASGPDAATVRHVLRQRHDAVLNLIESLP